MSPIKILKDAIESCMVNIAPENTNKILQIISKHKAAISLVKEASFHIRTDISINSHTGIRNITVPIQALEYLWAFNHMNWVLYQEYQRHYVPPFN